MTHSAAIDIDARAGGEIGGIGLHVGADHFALDTAIEGHVYELALMRKGWVIDRDGDLAIHQVHEGSERE